MTEILEFSFYPTPTEPIWGCLHVLTDDFEGNPWDRRATMRGDPELVRALKETYHDQGPVDASRAPQPPITGGTWQITPGWPDDWGQDNFAADNDSMWTKAFTIDADGRPAPLDD
jgi:hypothetical protein